MMNFCLGKKVIDRAHHIPVGVYSKFTNKSEKLQTFNLTCLKNTLKFKVFVSQLTEQSHNVTVTNELCSDFI